MEKSILTELFIVLTHPPSQPLFANIWLGNFWPARVAELSVWYLREFGKLVSSWSYITTNSQQPLDWIDSDMERLTVLLRLLSHQVFFYGGVAGCIDATLCPGSGQIVSINPEIGGLCPIRWRSGQREGERFFRQDVEERNWTIPACGIVVLGWCYMADTFWRIFT